MQPRTILLATTNAGKLREARAILVGLNAKIVTLTDLRERLPEPVEDAETFEGNAAIKALHYAKLAGCWALADDSGLEVDALGGAPGVHSSRYAGPGGDSAANNAKLVQALTDVPCQKRTARFRCAVALAAGGNVRATAAGAVEGVIIAESRGSNGFGYDPHFFVPHLGKTMAQLTPEQKNAISHRGNALRALRPQIEQLLRPPE